MYKCFWVLFVCLICVGGCQKGENLNAIQGAVTFGDAPLVSGNIVFVSAQSADGSQAAAPPTTVGIRDGVFTIPRKVGLKEGKYLVTICGFEGKARGDMPLGLPIFPDYKTTFEYTGQATHEFKVPGLKRPLPKVDEKALEATSSKVN